MDTILSCISELSIDEKDHVAAAKSNPKLKSKKSIVDEVDRLSSSLKNTKIAKESVHLKRDIVRKQTSFMIFCRNMKNQNTSIRRLKEKFSK